MDRQTVYPGQILPETVLLQMAKDSMLGVAKLSAAVLGTSTIANGFAVTPTGPASLQVLVAPGEIYSLTSIDATAYSSLAADTTHSIMKQGILLDGLTLNCPAPGTTGQSINYLIEATYQDLDANPLLLPYYNSANPALPFSGMGNNGLTQNTSRKGAAVVQVKAGASAATGSQTTPAPDAGYVGLYVVTVAFGQTTITSTSISQYASAPLLPAGLVPAVQSSAMTSAQDFGTANVYKANYFPAITALSNNWVLEFEVLTANTGAATFSPSGLTPAPIIGSAHSPLQGGELVAGGKAEVIWHSTLSSWVLLGCTGGALQVGLGTQPKHAVQLGQTPTETLGGAPKVATQTLVNAGADDTTFVTPKKLRWGFSASLTTNGYIVLPSWLGGLIIQWGLVAGSASADVTVTLPIAYPNACMSIITTTTSIGSGNTSNVNTATLSNFKLATWSANATRVAANSYWQSIGY